MGFTNNVFWNTGYFWPLVVPESARGGLMENQNWTPRAHLGRPASTAAILEHRDWQGKRHSPRGCL